MTLTEDLLRLIVKAVKAIERRQQNPTLLQGSSEQLSSSSSSNPSSISSSSSSLTGEHDLTVDIVVPFKVNSEDSTSPVSSSSSSSEEEGSENLDDSAEEKEKAGIQERKNVTIDFGKAFSKVDVIGALESKLGHSLPDVNDQASSKKLLEICEKQGLIVSPPHSCAHLLDKLLGLIEPSLIQPTFLIHHPRCLSPLAKAHPDVRRIPRNNPKSCASTRFSSVFLYVVFLF